MVVPVPGVVPLGAELGAPALPNRMSLGHGMSISNLTGRPVAAVLARAGACDSGSWRARKAGDRLLRGKESVAVPTDLCCMAGSGVRADALNYLRAHNTLTLATGGPSERWAAALFYVNDDFTLYWLSDPQARHSQHVARDPRVAVAIHEDYRDWRVIQGIQMEGLAEEVGEIRAAERPMRLYTAKYPFLGDRRNPPAALAEALERTRVYRFTPNRVFFIDNTRGFGHREEVDPAG